MSGDQLDLDADTCVRIFHAALAAGDIEGVRQVLTILAVVDPHRAQSLMDHCRVALAAIDAP